MTDNATRYMSLFADPEAERRALGTMLLSPAALSIGCEMLKSADFATGEHRHVFDALHDMYHRGIAPSLSDLADTLRGLATFVLAGGAPMLAGLSACAGLEDNVEVYCQEVLNQRIFEQVASAGSQIESRALARQEEAPALLDSARALLAGIAGAPAGEVDTARSVLGSDWYAQFCDQVDRVRAGGSIQHPGVSTGYYDLDALLTSFGDGHLVILAARPAMGKTALALNMAEYLALTRGIAIGFISLEMSAEQLVNRLVASRSGVSGKALQTRRVGDDDQHRVWVAFDSIVKHGDKLCIVEGACMSITQLRAIARTLVERRGCRLLIVDYLQLLSGSRSQRSAENRTQEVSEVTRLLKTMAVELSVPVLCLSQLNRRTEDRAAHIPLLSDLRDSGSIEQDADVVMFLVRPEYYKQGDKPGEAELYVAKNRHGPTGLVRLTFKADIARFESYAPPMPSCGHHGDKD